ncbi:MAG TPA: response regulator [Candidatus Polarisedimenticolaceae bacterium]|nr:response regulator [Candidatus Polarisedimenticolaceae bacterium]
MWTADISLEPEGVPPPVTRLEQDRETSTTPRRHLLLVEDSLADARLFMHRMQACDPDARVAVARDGASAIERLERIIEGTAPTPDLLVLDLNLPVLKGWDVLHYVKRSPLLRFIPVVVLSNSKAPRDVERAYSDGATSFIHKGRNLDDFFRVVDAIHAYWCGTTDLPQNPGTQH